MKNNFKKNKKTQINKYKIKLYELCFKKIIMTSISEKLM